MSPNCQRKLALLFGGSALVTVAYAGGLVASVDSFGGEAGLAAVGVVYMGACVIAAASPTPGGLGALEAALVAGLTGIGVSPGAAGVRGADVPADGVLASGAARLVLIAPARAH